MGRSDNGNTTSIESTLCYNAIANRNGHPAMFMSNELKTALQAILPEPYQEVPLQYIYQARQRFVENALLLKNNANVLNSMSDCEVGQLLCAALAPKSNPDTAHTQDVIVETIRIKWLCRTANNRKNGTPEITRQPVAIIVTGYIANTCISVRHTLVAASPGLGYKGLKQIVSSARGNGKNQPGRLSIVVIASNSTDSQELFEEFNENYIKRYLPRMVQKEGLHLPVLTDKGALAYEPLDPSRAILCARGPRDQKQSQKKR